jgi:hypothetical protein
MKSLSTGFITQNPLSGSTPTAGFVIQNCCFGRNTSHDFEHSMLNEIFEAA